MSRIDVICDHSQQNLAVVPLRVLEMCNLQMLYLEGNTLETLPNDLFPRLPKLNWLDLRNNKLRSIPTTVANHACLENLLLEHNCLEELPKELGLVPNLVVLQLGKNPIAYPAKDILSKGTESICFYLKNEYNKEHGLPLEMAKNPQAIRDNKKSLKQKIKRKEKIDVRELLRRASHHSRLQIENIPTISIRSLSAEPQRPTLTNEESSKAIACYSGRKQEKPRYCSKLSIPTHYNSNKYIGVKKSRPNPQRIFDHELKEIWMEKLREMLAEQERHLQQERNLQALSSWRSMKKLEAPRKIEGDTKIEAPYDTNPDYERMPSRIDLTKDIERILKRRKNVPRKNIDMQKLINELVGQLKMLEADTDQAQNTDLDKNEKEIQKIISVHKKIVELQQKNENIW